MSPWDLLSLVSEPVFDLPLKCVNPGDQSRETSLVDLLMEPGNLFAQVAKIIINLARALTGSGVGLECTVCAVGQLADLLAELGRTRPGAIIARNLLPGLRLGVCHSVLLP
jgi:hypothetical protein